jgi:hypothetical protein
MSNLFTGDSLTILQSSAFTPYLKKVRTAIFSPPYYGIVEERKTMTEKGNLDHPVFKIVCLSDLWDSAKIVKVKKEKAKK